MQHTPVDEKCAQEDLGTDGNISEWGKLWEGVDRMHLAQDRDQWKALVNMVKNHQVP
jgi:hypothetical protein